MRRASAFLLVVAPLLFSGAVAYADFSDGGDEDAGQVDAGAPELDAGVPSDAGYEEVTLPDAGVPDASIGEGGADRDSEESEDTSDRVPTVCRRSAECAPGFECQDAHCRWTGIRHAEGGGCLGAVPGLIAVIGLVAVRKRRSE